VACHLKVRNCALCGTTPSKESNEIKCKMCIDNYILNNVTNANGDTVEECVFDLCPA